MSNESVLELNSDELAMPERNRSRRVGVERPSRAQESRASEAYHAEDDGVDWEPKGLLDTSHIPPRPGFVQRWVRTQINGIDDPNNVGKRLNQGWRPRVADTVPQGHFVPTIVHQGSSVIGMVGQILMERPESLHHQHRRYIRSMTDAQAQAVNEDVYRVHESGHGFGRPVVHTQSQVSRGRARQAPVADD